MAKPVYLTALGLEKLTAELAHLKQQQKQAADRIRDARAFGDLSENAEYEDARNQQAFIEGRIQELEEKMKHAQVIAGTAGGVVALGSTIAVDMGRGSQEYTLVGPTEADPAAGRISSESPIGQALLSSKAGETVTAETPGGQLAIKVLSVS